MRSLNDHIRFYLLIILIPTLIFISAVDYQQTNDNIKNNFNKQKINAKESIEDSIELIDNRNVMLSDIFSKQMKQNSQPFLKAYNQSSSIRDIRLNSVKNKMNWSMELDTVDLYVINKTGVIVNTTYKNDMGLDFKNFPDFYSKLEAIFEKGEFTSDLITAEINTGKFKIFSYMPTPDSKYILEIGVYSEELNDLLGKRSYQETANRLKGINPYVEDLRIFHYNGVLISDPLHNTSKRVNEICLNVYNNKTNVTEIYDDRGVKKEYILVHLPHEEYPSEASKIVELTYDENLKDIKLRQNLYLHIFIGALSVIILTLTIFLVSKYITKPVYDIISDIDKITKGKKEGEIKLDKETKIEELDILKESTNNMLNKLRKSITELNDSKERERFLKSLLRQDANNNLFVSIGFLQLIDKENLSSEDREYLEKAIKSNKRIMDLVKLEKEVNNSTEGYVDKINLDNIFKKVLDESKKIFEEKDIDIDLEVEKNIGNIKGGQSLITIIITLIKTCIRRGGCSKIRLNGKGKGDQVKISIEDNGNKIPDTIKQKILEGRYTGGSSGIGGAIYFIVKEILDIYDGRLDINDSKMGGTRVDIYLKKN